MSYDDTSQHGKFKSDLQDLCVKLLIKSLEFNSERGWTTCDPVYLATVAYDMLDLLRASNGDIEKIRNYNK
jgi:hypothetical protein